jgi:hypothetical protein
LKKLILFLSWPILGPNRFFAQVRLGGFGLQRGDFGKFMFQGDALEAFMLAPDSILEAGAVERHDLKDLARDGFTPVDHALHEACSLADAKAVSSH